MGLVIEESGNTESVAYWKYCGVNEAIVQLCIVFGKRVLVPSAIHLYGL